MRVPSKENPNDTIWRNNISMRVRRIEVFFFIMTMSFVAFMFFMIDSSQRERKVALSSLLTVQETISSLGETQAKLTSQIDSMNEKISEKEQQKHTKQTTKPLPSIHRQVAATSNHSQMNKRKAGKEQRKQRQRTTKPLLSNYHKDFPITHLIKQKENTIESMRSTSVPHSETVFRKMQLQENITESVTLCNEALFRLELQLDGNARQNSFMLLSMETGNIIANKTFDENDSLTDISFEICLKDGHYKFMLMDDWADGITCEKSLDGLPCYNVYINDVLAIPGKPFLFMFSENFETGSLCLTDNLVIYELNLDIIRTQAEELPTIHKITNIQTKKEIEFLPVPDQDENTNKTSFFQCLSPSIYDFELFSGTNSKMLCNGPCYTVSVKDKIIIQGKNSYERAKHKFFITVDGSGREQTCRSNPLLAPINEMSRFEFDERVSNILDVIQALSNVQDIFIRGTSQNQAACYILNDDPLQIQAEDPMLPQRYALAVFLYSLNEMTEVHLPLNACHNNDINCNEQGDIGAIVWGGGGLNGYIPTEIGHFEGLSALFIESKDLVGTIPTEMERLINLNHLRLSNNKLTGTIPTVLGNLPLTTIMLGDNSLTGEIPTELGMIETLSFITLENNLLTGVIPPVLFNSRSLEIIYLGGNHLVGSIPSEIGELENVSMFAVHSNELTGTIPPGFGNVRMLNYLDLGHNGLTGTIPTELESITHQLNDFFLNDNFLSGTIPNIHATRAILLKNNSLIGTIPESFFNLSIPNLALDDNKLVGQISPDLCSKVSNLAVDHSPWFLDEPLVTCPCCDDAKCHMWENDETIIVGGTRKPRCPKSNVLNIDIFELIQINDDVANVSIRDFIGTETAGEYELCLSPTGCFSVKHDVVNGRHDQDRTWDREYKVGFSSASKSLEEKETCDAVNICGFTFGPDHPKRIGLNHLTHVILSDLSILDDASLPEYKALCWIMTQDTMFHDYDVCDGTLLQRYIMVLFYYTYQRSFGFDTLNPAHTCEWPGVKCDRLNRYIEHLDFSGDGLVGWLMTEIGQLTRLKTLALSGNNLVGTMDSSIFEYMPNLEVFNVSSNKFGGTLPKTLLQLPRIEDIILSNNLIIGELPRDVEYSKSIKKFDVKNNLIVSEIPAALFVGPKLEVINLSRNNFQGHIPSAIGLLENIREIHLDQNSLSGNLPTEMLNLKHMERLAIQSNSFTGTIPTEIGNLKNVIFISLSHNFLKGIIPKELEGLNKIEHLHLHDNFLTGQAPDMHRLNELGKLSDDLETYITDCGDPSFLLSKPILCTSCTLCCNSDKLCQENRVSRLSIEKGAFIAVFGVPVVVGIIYTVIYFLINLWNAKMQVLGERDATTMVDQDSTYCLIFSNSYVAWTIYLIVFFLQGCFYYMFLLASSFTSDSSDWQFTFQCPASGASCENFSDVDIFGWIMFFVVTILTLLVDYINSTLLILKSVAVLDLRMFVSGCLHMGMTVLALFCSFYYNLALATTNTELIVNAVILLFINDLDEQLMNAMQALVPGWVGTRIEEIGETLSNRSKDIEPATPSEIRTEGRELDTLGGPKYPIEEKQHNASSSSEVKASNSYLSQDDTFLENYIQNAEPAIETIYVRSSEYANKS